MEIPKTNLAISELTFSLYQRPLHPELFNIYAKRYLRTEKYETTIWITGCSHLVSIYSDNMWLTELIAAPGQVMPKKGLIERFGFKGKRNHKYILGKHFSYITDFQVEKMSPNLYRQSLTDLEKFPRNRGVFVTFPKSTVGGLEPFSYIDFEARRYELHIHTFHAYPEKTTIIKTQSLFDFH